MRQLTIAALIGAVLLTCAYLVQRSFRPEPALARLGVDDILTAEGKGFERALAPRSFEFPADHGAHPGYRSEWWYFTGNLQGGDGRRFGYQLTVFRHALGPEQPDSTSRWRSNQVMLGHLNVTDAAGRRFLSRERLSRAAAGLAGYRSRPVRVWLRDWEITHRAATDSWLLEAESDGVGVRFELRAQKPPVLHGERGLSRKSAAAGNASYYYSSTRLDTHGRLFLDDETFVVDGASWLDREWSTSALDRQQSGWDWFGVQLSNGTELMYYQLRNRDGTVAPQSAGSFVSADGKVRALQRSDVALSVLQYWRSPHSAVRYPSGWRLAVPRLELTLEIHPLQSDQEVNLSFRYWEGAVAVTGQHHGRAVTGNGYVELTGYE